MTLNPPPDFTTFLFYDTYAFFLITIRMPDARQPDLKNGEQALRRIRHTPQGNANAANAAGGILMVNQGCLKNLFYATTHAHWEFFYFQ